MSANDVIIIGPFRYTVIKRENSRVLIGWREATGIYKETWLLLKKCRNIN